MAKQLLIIAHAPSDNTRMLRDALCAGAAGDGEIQTRCLSPFDTVPEHILQADGVLIFTPENLGYMSGALKDCFDRCYYPTLDHKQGLPYALVIRAGNDGRGTQRAVETIVTGLRWRAVAEALICRGAFQSQWLEQCRELAAGIATGLNEGII